MIEQGLLRKTEGDYPVLKLTEASTDVLRGKRTVELVKAKVSVEGPPARGEKADTPYIRELFEDLRQLRTVLAKRENVPPYVVFADSSLIEMASLLPQNEDEMKSVSGVGDLKYEKYGNEFLSEVRKFCRSHELESRMYLKRAVKKASGRKRTAAGRTTFQVSYDMFLSGMSVAEIAATRGLGLSTIEGHLARFIESGEIRLDELVPLQKISVIKKAIETCDNPEGRLAPIKEMLGDDYSYGEIRAVMAALGVGCA